MSYEGHPTLKTLRAVLTAVGMGLSVEPEQTAAAWGNAGPWGRETGGRVGMN